MRTKAVTRSLAVLSLQLIKEQFPQRWTLKIGLSWPRPCQPHPNESLPEPVSAASVLSGPWPEAPGIQTGGSLPKGEGPCRKQALGRRQPSGKGHGVLGTSTCCLSSGEQEAFSNQRPVTATAVTQRSEDGVLGTSERALGKQGLGRLEARCAAAMGWCLAGLAGHQDAVMEVSCAAGARAGCTVHSEGQQGGGWR